MRVVVTGSSGKIGRQATAQLSAAGHRVRAFDINSHADAAPAVPVDCTDLGQVMDALSGIDMRGGRPDAVVHLAGIPAPGLAADATIFTTNTISTYNVMTACARLGIPRLVWASSETILGLPFAIPPEFLPLTEDHPDRPEWHYSLSKQLGEQMAEALSRWHPGLSIVSLRISNVYEPADYANLTEIQADPAARKLNLWSYVDARDAARACLLACEADLSGHQRMIVAAADTIMDTPTKELVAQFFPTVPVTGSIDGHQSLLSSRRAGELIGYTPTFSWRE